MSNLWTITEDSFEPSSLHHQETIFTIGNGYLSTRGAFQEGYAWSQPWGIAPCGSG